MSEQEPHAEQGSVQHTSNVDTSFDELAKGLTNGTLSRRKALRMFGAALVGGMLASIPGVAWAARPEGAGRPEGVGRPGGCPSPRIRCRGQCCAEGVTTCQGTGKNKTCGPAAPAACPVTCCCGCLYINNETGAGISTCMLGYTTLDFEEGLNQCARDCQANTPEGFTYHGVNSYGCEGANSGNQPENMSATCEPTTDGLFPGTVCGHQFGCGTQA